MDTLQKYKTDHAYTMKWAKKIIACKSLGGKCNYCEVEDVRVLQFHHLNPDDKEFNVSANKAMHLDLLLNEVKKCELICANCHAEKHQEERGDSVVLRRRNTKIALLAYKEKYSCEICSYRGQNYASLDFHHINPKEKIMKPIQDACIYGLTEKVCNELDKCIVICKNCHTKHHIKTDKFDKLYPKILDKVDNHIPRTKLDWNQVYVLAAQGKKLIEMARIMNCSSSAISYILNKTANRIGDAQT